MWPPSTKFRANRLFAIFVIWLVILTWPALAAPVFPQLAGEPVVDVANLLDPAQEAALNAKLKSVEATTGRQLAVATIPDLGGYDIADYGYQLGRAWGIGKEGANDGVVLIVAPTERRTRIEVGYGLEPILTDAYSGLIINNVMIPHFRAGDYPGGIDAGVDAIADQIKLPPDEAAARAAAAGKQMNDRRSQGSSIVTVIFWLFVGLFIIVPMLLRRAGGGRIMGGVGDVILWSALNSATNGRNSDGWGGGGGFGGGGGGFSGGGGSFGGGGASGGW